MGRVRIIVRKLDPPITPRTADTSMSGLRGAQDGSMYRPGDPNYGNLDPSIANALAMLIPKLFRLHGGEFAMKSTLVWVMMKCLR